MQKVEKRKGEGGVAVGGRRAGKGVRGLVKEANGLDLVHSLIDGHARKDIRSKQQ